MLSFNSKKIRLGLRSKVTRVVVAALVGSLLMPLAQMSVPALQEQSAAAQLTTLAAPEVTSITAGAAGLLVSWTAPPSYTGSSTVTGYRVEYSLDGNTAKPSVITAIALYPSTKAPLAAKGAKWVAVSYRVDSFKGK